LPVFTESIKTVSEELGTNIVLALDPMGHDSSSLSRKCVQTLEAVAPYICAVKINRPLVLKLCLEKEVKALLKLAHNLGLVTIMDAKLNDVAHTNLAAAVQYFDAGFDALTASPFVGWEGGLDSVFEEASRRGKGMILLVHMSHRGSVEGYGQTVLDGRTGEKRPQFMVFAEKAVSWGADGAIVGATNPERIAIVRTILRGRVPIYAPGVIAQGGSPEAAIEAGADYLIVGRAIYDSANAEESARSIRDDAVSASNVAQG